jgi:hypothetical protein
MQLVPGVGVTGDVPTDLLPLLFDLPNATGRELAASLATDTHEEASLRSRAAAMVQALLERGLIELRQPN